MRCKRCRQGKNEGKNRKTNKKAIDTNRRLCYNEIIKKRCGERGMRVKDDQRKREEELDAFWTIDALLPRNKKTTVCREDTEAIDIMADPVLNGDAEKNPNTATESGRISFETITQNSFSEKQRKEETDEQASQKTAFVRYIPPHTANEEKRKQPPERVWEMNGSMVHTVRVYPWPTKYTYFDQFCENGERLLTAHGSPCEPEPFFSYVPQYAQMNAKQLAWYLFWRDCVRKQQYPKTDSSYIQLYVFELIHFSDRIPPCETQKQLCALWLAYYRDHPFISHYMREWICDFGLMHGLSAPKILLEEQNRELIAGSSLREYYLNCADTDSPDGSFVQTLLSFCTNYNYKKSKFYTSDTAPLFDAVIKGVLHACIREMTDATGHFSIKGLKDITYKRDTFVGVLCAAKHKKHLEIDAYSFSRSHELRFLITDLIKYTENKIRISLGIKARLSVGNLPNFMQEMADAYLQKALPEKSRVKEREPEAPAYEKLYDLPMRALSVEHAVQIEENSWDTTRQLISAFDQSETVEKREELPDFLPQIAVSDTKSLPIAVADSSEETEQTEPSLLAKWKPYLHLLLEGRQKEASVWARQQGFMEDAIADEINGVALSLPQIGDILLEETENGYAVITDYIEILKTELGDEQ